MKITLVQSSPTLSRDNLQRCIDIIKKHGDSSDVLVFSELELNGYLLQDKLFEDAYELYELAELFAACDRCDVVIGAAIKDGVSTYNSALYISKGELKHLHHKVHLPNYGMFEEARYFFKGESIDSFDSCGKKAVMIVCEDLWRATTIAEISQIMPDIVYVLVASPARGFNDKELSIETQWNALLSTLALLSRCHVVFVNRVGFEDGLGFWGGSRIITPKGEIQHKLEYFEQNIKPITLEHQLYRSQKWVAKIG